MSNQEYLTNEQYMNKSKWRAGEWLDEPDVVTWVSHGLECMIVRRSLGALCGYVAIPESNDLHGVHYMDEASYSLSPHGGITYSENSHPLKTKLCTEWWFGFDCAHGGDHCPAYHRGYPTDVYRNLSYVTAQVNDLAYNLAQHNGETP